MGPNRRVERPCCGAGGRLMFRLAENTSAILVHRSVRDAIEAAGIEAVRFVEPADFLG